MTCPAPVLQVINKGGISYKNSPWHRECFTCTNCNKQLAGEKFTSKDEQPYCGDCFGELFAKRCCRCTKPITGKRRWERVCVVVPQLCACSHRYVFPQLCVPIPTALCMFPHICVPTALSSHSHSSLCQQLCVPIPTALCMFPQIRVPTALCSHSHNSVCQQLRVPIPTALCMFPQICVPTALCSHSHSVVMHTYVHTQCEWMRWHTVLVSPFWSVLQVLAAPSSSLSRIVTGTVSVSCATSAQPAWWVVASSWTAMRSSAPSADGANCLG